MKILGFISPDASVDKASLLLSLGWVLADAGFRVTLLDLDPQARLTELVGGQPDESGSVLTALSPLLDGSHTPGPIDPLRLTPNLLLMRGHLQMCTLDDQLATAWGTTIEAQARLVADGIAQLIHGLGNEHEANVVLCDLGTNLGPLNRAIVDALDEIIAVLAPDRFETALRSLDAILQRWGASSTKSSRAIDGLGLITMGSPGSTRSGSTRSGSTRSGSTRSGATRSGATRPERAASASILRDRTHLGTIPIYPGLASISRAAHKPDIELTSADGAMGAHLYAIQDLRVQYEALATAIMNAAGLFTTDDFANDLVENVEQTLYGEPPFEVEGLSSHVTYAHLSGVKLDRVEIRRGGLRVAASASVNVEHEREEDGASAAGTSLPLLFEIDLDRSHEIVTSVHRLEIDTPSDPE